MINKRFFLTILLTVLLVVLVIVMVSVRPAGAQEPAEEGDDPSSAQDPLATPSLELTGVGRMEATLLSPAGDVSILALAPVDCAVLSPPVVGYEISKGQDPDDITDFINDLATNGFNLGTVDISGGVNPPPCVDVLIVQGLRQNQALTATYTLAEGALLKAWVASGHGLMLSGDWGVFRAGTEELFQAYGYSQQGSNPVSDSDPSDFDPAEPTNSNIWVIYQQADNFAGSPILNGVTSLELLASSWLSPTTHAIVTTDADANAVPPGASVMAAFADGAGCVALTVDSNWNAVIGTAAGYFKQDNPKVARQMVEWLNGCASPPAPTSFILYLPLVLRNYFLATFPLFIGNAIPTRPVAYPGEVFYSTSVQIPSSLPADGHFYFSSDPNQVSPVVVDDDLVVLLNGTAYFTHHFSPGCQPVQPAIVEVPRTTMEQLAGQTVTVEYRDVCSSVVYASSMWLIWTP